MKIQHFLQRTIPGTSNMLPGGSSGGSAAAVGARLALIATGSDTGGSIRQPGALCGVVGFKPTYGRVSRFGLVAFGSSLDQIGPLATTVADAGLAMEVMGRHCPHDSTSLPLPPESYLDSLNHLNMDEITFGVPWHFLENLASPARDEFFQRSRCSERAWRQNHRYRSRYLQIFGGDLLHFGDSGSFDQFGAI